MWSHLSKWFLLAIQISALMLPQRAIPNTMPQEPQHPLASTVLSPFLLLVNFPQPPCSWLVTSLLSVFPYKEESKAHLSYHLVSPEHRAVPGLRKQVNHSFQPHTFLFPSSGPSPRLMRNRWRSVSASQRPDKKSSGREPRAQLESTLCFTDTDRQKTGPTSRLPQHCCFSLVLSSALFSLPSSSAVA